MSKRHETLSSEKPNEKQVGAITLQFPKELAESASLILNILLDIIPVVESSLETPLEGKIHLKVLSKGHGISTDPAAGVIRYTLSGNEVRSPNLAGQLSYELGKILWYRGSSDINYTGNLPRTPIWLQETILLHLKHIWLDRSEWLELFRRNLELCKTYNLLSTKTLNKIHNLSLETKQLAEAQCLLRGNSITQRFPKWYSHLSRMLSIDFDLRGEKGLEVLTSTNLEAWEELFLTDIEVWLRANDKNSF